MSEDESSRKLLSDANVTHWYANLGEGSEITAGTYLRRLNRFCEEFQTTPEGFARIDSKGAYDLELSIEAAELQLGKLMVRKAGWNAVNKKKEGGEWTANPS